MWQFMASFVHRLLQKGCSAHLLISPNFGWMNKQYVSITHYNDSPDQIHPLFKRISSYIRFNKSHYDKIFQEYPPKALLIVSWHTLNFPLIRMIKSRYPQAKILFWLHEPYKDEKKIYGLKALLIWFIEFLQTLCLRYADAVILHSRRGLRLFNKRYPEFKGIKEVIPLHFQDDGFDTKVSRRYISFLGRADRAKGIEEFFQLVEAGARRQLNYDFQIVTSSDIQQYLNGLSATALRKLRVVHRPRLSDNELREGAANSLAVLALYRETMQSGVIPIALMKGTPIIGTNVEGITEWIRDRETGVIISNKPTIEEFQAAITYIQDHIEDMMVSCRSQYLATFDDRNWDKHYGWLRSIIP